MIVASETGLADEVRSKDEVLLGWLTPSGLGIAAQVLLFWLDRSEPRTVVATLFASRSSDRGLSGPAAQTGKWAGLQVRTAHYLNRITDRSNYAHQRKPELLGHGYS